MISPAVSLAPVVRPLRAVDGRRALQLALLFGGLIVLGLLCAGRAQASDSVGGVVPGARLSADPVERVSAELHLPASAQHLAQHPVQPQHPARKPVQNSVQNSVQHPVREPAQNPVPNSAQKSDGRQKAVVSGPGKGAPHALRAPAAASDIVRPFAGTVRSAVRQVVEPVVVLAGEVREAGGGLVGAVARPLPSGPVLLPQLPGIPGPPGAGAEPPAASVGTADPQPAARGAAQHPTAQRSAGATGDDPAWFGGESAAGGQSAVGARHVEARPAAPSVPPRPDNAPVANASVGDGGSTRHGDLHAAAFGSRVPVLLTPGATASGDARPVLDRLREIPRFPG
ncbi:hypothetical protein [Streptomyces sp. NPDC057694]|uniref:hypothetical protein n=1 Tax=Streptomyces sp. NPDC057694 TaxID=3346216 RepID=UPI003680F8D1